MKEKCLVSGNAGFIGSHIADALIDRGCEVYGMDNLSTGREQNINPRVDFNLMDVRERRSWESLPTVDYVFHTAALARIPRSIKDPVETNDVNVRGTLNALEYCRRVGAKMIYSSSSSVYGDASLPTKEDHPKSPENPYALQKLMGEEYLRIYQQLFSIGGVALRYFNVYGERQVPGGAYSSVIGIFLDQKSKGQPLTITGNGEQKRDFTYVKDIVQANLLAIGWRGVVNIGAGDNKSINEIAEAVGGEKRHIDERPGEMRETLADNSKARELGWQPTKNVLEWIREQT